MEGCPNIAAFAKSNFDQLQAKHIQQVIGNFDNTLPSALQQFETLDYAFIDGNHREQATIDYFNLCLEKAHEYSVFVIDDIYWSEGMLNAWKTIQAHPKVTLTIDLFVCGLVFFRTEQLTKQHFKLRKNLFY